MNTKIRDTEYHQFHSKRRQKLLDYVERRTRGWKKKGGNDCPAVRTDYAYDGMAKLPGHKDKDIWDAAWKACIKSINQTMKEPLYTFKTENGNIPIWNGSFLCFPTREQAIIEGKKFNATHTLALLAHEGGQWATITEEAIEP